jgi:hypothetical protein
MGIAWEFHGHLGGELGGGGHAPYFTCDTCGKKLQDGQGKIVWERKENPGYTEGEVVSTGKYWILGKGPDHLGCDGEETKRHPWDDLDDFLSHVTFNSKLDLQQSEARARERREKFGL